MRPRMVHLKKYILELVLIKKILWSVSDWSRVLLIGVFEMTSQAKIPPT